MPTNPSVILSAFADEAANRKSAVEQFSALAAVGLRYYSPRFIDVAGNGQVKHVTELDAGELEALKKLHAEYGMSVTSIGSRIGKVKLCDVNDGTHNKFVPFPQYMKDVVAPTIRAAVALETKLIRGFSFYPPRGEDVKKHIPQAVDQIGQLADACRKEGLIYGLEIEPNLVGETGQLNAELAAKADRPNVVLIFDGGNIACQNKNRLTVFEEYEAMRPHLGWLHIKDYAVDPSLTWTGHVDEERLKNFVPADRGGAGHEAILRDLREHLPAIDAKMKKLGAPGVFLEVEPHLKGGGQFGGFSGPDGVGVAVRSLCRILDFVGIDYRLRDFEDIRAARGF